MTHNTPHDLQLRFLLPAAGVRGVVVQLQDTWQAISQRAVYPQAIAELLGEAAAAAALFTGHAKVDGRLSVQLRGQGALRTLFTECTAA
ncbi:MAG: Hsp33 family molecular chaperone HslO, partial [Thermomonas sp.]